MSKNYPKDLITSVGIQSQSRSWKSDLRWHSHPVTFHLASCLLSKEALVTHTYWNTDM